MGVFFPAATKGYLRRRAGTGFMDTCQRLTHTPGAGDYGYGPATYPAGASMACLFVEEPVLDAQSETAVPMADGRLYLALTETLLPADRVKITHKRGDTIAEPKTYEISKGPSHRDATMYAELKLVTDGS